MKTDREKHGLRGPVESVHTETACPREQDGQLTEQPEFSHTLTFNRDGWITERVDRYPDGPTWRTLHDYSETGLLLSARSYDAPGQLLGEVRYVYDLRGRVIAKQSVALDGAVTTLATYTYDNEGRKTKIETLDSSERPNTMIVLPGTTMTLAASEALRCESRYDAGGNLVEVSAYNPKGELAGRVEITRDERGNAIEETDYSGVGRPLVGWGLSASCSTMEEKDLTEEQRAEIEAKVEAEIARLFPPGQPASRRASRYDEKGRLIESKSTAMGMSLDHATFEYDELGNKSKESHFFPDGRLLQAITTRECDEQGNWITESVSTVRSGDDGPGSTPSHVNRRTITYY